MKGKKTVVMLLDKREELLNTRLTPFQLMAEKDVIVENKILKYIGDGVFRLENGWSLSMEPGQPDGLPFTRYIFEQE